MAVSVLVFVCLSVYMPLSLRLSFFLFLIRGYHNAKRESYLGFKDKNETVGIQCSIYLHILYSSIRSLLTKHFPHLSLCLHPRPSLMPSVTQYCQGLRAHNKLHSTQCACVHCTGQAWETLSFSARCHAICCMAVQMRKQ